MIAETEQAIEWNNKECSPINLGRYDEALPYFDKALKIDPDDKKAWFYEGLSLDFLGRHR